jgi:putative DNA modification/repair radical SAM protein
MDVRQKLEILADAAKYDVSCASSGVDRSGKGGVGNATACGICHSWSADGRCISLLKVLMTNRCRYDCAYCVNRASNDRPRASFAPREITELTMNFYRRNFIEGLFLSSAVEGSPDATMERMIEILRILRKEERFFGYIHVKVIPGASPDAIDRAARLADRVSVNIELPSRDSLRAYAPDKTADAILSPMGQLHRGLTRALDERKVFESVPRYMPSGQSTQMIVGASGESDRQIIMLAQGLYRKFAMRRVYYSAYVPVGDEKRLPALPNPPLLREHRLYQCDFLQRQYGFHADEILPEAHPFLDPLLDPKAAWALRNLDHFPIEVNAAPYETLLRIPGVGKVGAKRIVAARRAAPLQADDLKRLGVVLKRAKYFVTCKGKYLGGVPIREDVLSRAMTSQEALSLPGGLYAEQTSLFPAQAVLPPLPDIMPLLPRDTQPALPPEVPDARP